MLFSHRSAWYNKLNKSKLKYGRLHFTFHSKLKMKTGILCFGPCNEVTRHSHFTFPPNWSEACGWRSKLKVLLGQLVKLAWWVDSFIWRRHWHHYDFAVICRHRHIISYYMPMSIAMLMYMPLFVWFNGSYFIVDNNLSEVNAHILPSILHHKINK